MLTSLGLWPLYLLLMVIRRRLRRSLTRAPNGCAQATKDALKHVRRLKRYLCDEVFADCFTSASASASARVGYGVGVGRLDESLASQPPSTYASTSIAFDARQHQEQNQNGVDARPSGSSPPKRARDGLPEHPAHVTPRRAQAQDVPVEGEQHSSLLSLARPALAARPLSGRDTEALSTLGPERFLELYFSHKFRRLYELLASEFAAPAPSPSLTCAAQSRQRCFPHLFLKTFTSNL